MKKYIIPVAAFLLIGTAAGAQTEKKQHVKPMTTKPATTNAARSTRSKPVMVDSTSRHTTTSAIKRRTHTKPAGTAPASTGSK